jgi:hypothetical protein
MKITWTSLKGVCLLLLGLATTIAGRSFAADINLTNFSAFAESSTATTAGTAVANPNPNPFRDETVGAPAKAVPAEPAVPSTLPPATAGTPTWASDDFAGAPGRYWFRGEFVQWFPTGVHLPIMVSTLTGSNALTPATLFGDQTVDNGNHNGYRVDFGMWLDYRHVWGLDADYFDVTGKGSNYDSGATDGYANSNAFPIVRLLYDPSTFNLPYPNGGLSIDAVGYPQYCYGRITVQTSDYFQTAGLTLRRELRASEWSTSNRDVNWTDPAARTFRLDALAGYRFARLMDAVNEEDNSFVFAPPSATNLVSDNAFDYINNYRTVNSFNGGELGMNAAYTRGRWSLDVVGKAALGVNNEYVNLYNQETIEVSNARQVGTPLQVVNPTPTQVFSRNRFSAIPELTVTAGYQVMDHLKVTVGYDLLYWSAVVRAADQIAVEPTTGYPYGTASGNYSALPAFSWNESHYFAEGLRLGAEFRF